MPQRRDYFAHDGSGSSLSLVSRLAEKQHFPVTGKFCGARAAIAGSESVRQSLRSLESPTRYVFEQIWRYLSRLALSQRSDSASLTPDLAVVVWDIDIENGAH